MHFGTQPSLLRKLEVISARQCHNTALSTLPLGTLYKRRTVVCVSFQSCRRPRPSLARRLTRCPRLGALAFLPRAVTLERPTWFDRSTIIFVSVVHKVTAVIAEVAAPFIDDGLGRHDGGSGRRAADVRVTVSASSLLRPCEISCSTSALVPLFTLKSTLARA